MAIKIDLRSRSLPILIGVVAVAAGMWGTYAWRAMQTPHSASPIEVKSEPSAAVTPLRATRSISDIIKQVEAETPSDSTSTPPANPVAVVPEPLVAEMTSPNPVRANSPPSASVEPVARPLLLPQPELHANDTTPAPVPKAASKSEPIVAKSSTSNMEMGRSALARGNMIEARSLLSAALDRSLPAADQSFIRSELARFADALLFSKATNTNDPLTIVHTIAPGDTFHVIAARHHITEELLGRINGVSEPNRLHVGQRIKCIRGPFRASIYKSEHRMDIYLDQIFVRSFAVGLGQDGYTPTGTWVVNSKLRNPSWTDPVSNRHFLADDPDNPIGERWIGLSGIDGDAVGKVGFGIHGTIDPSSIGRDKSMGCIRLSAADVELVYDLLVPQHSQILIQQ